MHFSLYSQLHHAKKAITKTNIMYILKIPLFRYEMHHNFKKRKSMEGSFPYRCRFTSFPKSVFLFLGINLLGSQFFVFWHLVMQPLYKVYYIKHQVSLYLWRKNLYLSAVKFQNIRSLVAANEFKCRKFHQSLVESRKLNKP